MEYFLYIVNQDSSKVLIEKSLDLAYLQSKMNDQSVVYSIESDDGENIRILF